jgi:hypothetical protein
MGFVCGSSGNKTCFCDIFDVRLTGAVPGVVLVAGLVAETPGATRFGVPRPRGDGIRGAVDVRRCAGRESRGELVLEGGVAG